jgi:polar amino acid transport system substrate-binding protein
MIRFTFYMALLLTMVSAANSAHAQKPYEFVRIKGLSEQIVGERLLTEIYRRAKIPMNITAMTGSRALEEASSGRKDGETLRVYTLGDKFPSLLRVPTAISDLTTQAFGIKKTGVYIETADNLKKYSLAINRGVRHTLNITQGLENVHVLPSSNLFIPFLSRGRADLGLTGRLNGLSLIKVSGIKNVELIGKPLAVLPLYHYIHKDHEDLVPVISEVVKTMVDRGEMARLRAQFEQEYLDSIKTITQ